MAPKEKQKQALEPQGWNHAEVDRRDGVRMVVQECPPYLRWRVPVGNSHTSAAGGGAHSEPQPMAGSPMGLAPVDEGERLRDRVDLIVVTNARKSEQLGHEFI